MEKLPVPLRNVTGAGVLGTPRDLGALREQCLVSLLLFLPNLCRSLVHEQKLMSGEPMEGVENLNT